MKVAWISDFGLEWLPDLPEPLSHLPRKHALSWQRVLLGELEKEPGLELHIIVLRKHIEQSLSFQRQGVFFHVLKVPAPRAPSMFWVDTFLLKPLLKRLQPNVVHAWGTEKGAALIASRLDYPFLVTIQGLLQWYGELVPLAAYERLTALLERWSLRRTKVVTTESTFAVSYLHRKYPSLAVEQVEHAPAWLFHQVIRKPQTAPLRFLFVGTLDYRKGIDLLLQAFHELLPELPFELVLVGGKPDQPSLQPFRGQVSPEFWKRVQFLPQVQPAQIAEELAKATMLVMPTRADTSPNAVKEAVVAGVPVVASRIGGIPDYVFPGENGLLFPSGDLGALKSTLQAACRHSLFGRGLVSPASLSKTRDYLSPIRMQQRFIAIYNQVNQHQSKRLQLTKSLA